MAPGYWFLLGFLAGGVSVAAGLLIVEGIRVYRGFK